MTRTHLIALTTTAVLALTGAGIAAGAQTGGDQLTGSQAPAVTLEEAIATAEARFPGRVLEAELEDEDGKAFYEVESATASGDLLRSGWYFKASCRYACWIWSRVADRSTPNTS